MKGLQLSRLTDELHEITEGSDSEPSRSVHDIEAKLGRKTVELLRSAFPDKNFFQTYHNLPLAAFQKFTHEELCKFYTSSTFMMHESVRSLFERNPRYEVVRKIANSMWRWSAGPRSWNETVRAYKLMRSFRFLDDPRFEVRLDFATYHLEYGYSKYSRTYIDGSFAYLVYFKGEHTLTIGFSVLSGHRILLQQVQASKRTGNRGLYRLPPNRVEFAIDLFMKNFPGYELYVISGNSLYEKTVASYREVLAREKNLLGTYVNLYDQPRSSYADQVRQDVAELERKIAHIEADRDRIIALYDDIGRFKRGNARIDANKLSHRSVRFPKAAANAA